MAGGDAGVPEPLRGAVERLGGEASVDEEGRLLLVFRERGRSLVDLGVEALEALRGYRVVVIVERGAGHDGSDYYYYIYPWEVEELLKKLGRGG